MRTALRGKLLLGAFAAFIVLAIVGSFYYGSVKKRALESSAASAVADATARLREASATPLDAAQAAAQLQVHEAALAQHLARLRAEDASRNKVLAEAAELYLVDVHAILRVQGNAARALAAAHASQRALAAHLENAEGRGTGWIQRALALKARAERDNFDYRTAVGALAGLFYAHRESQDKLRTAAPGAPLLEEARRAALHQAAKDAEAQAAQDLEQLRRLPIG
jgi:exonuclease SbcC